MTENQSITGRLKNELMNNLAVSIVAVLLAFVALALTAVSESITGELYIALNIAVWIPYAYEAYWPVKYSTGAAAAWTVCAALITSGLYIGSYLVAANFLSSDIIPAIAFVVTIAIQFGIVVLFARIRRNT